MTMTVQSSPKSGDKRYKISLIQEKCTHLLLNVDFFPFLSRAAVDIPSGIERNKNY